ncbi:cyclase [Haloferax prahovense DSM 18310]|uniref:Cyclase n=1 Tax=Haloferax prahovense (strain DSM 18310 / JCM 13924 / TL6) TaxID=1227461 RepID=M0FZD6_HALPT|nr:cyclase [Haloferax prahovense DSM 18310]
MRFQTSMGTSLDSPYHRHPEGRDISELEISELILPGTIVDARELAGDEELTVDALPERLTSKAPPSCSILDGTRTGGSEEYRTYPYISEGVIERLIDADVSLVGVDTLNADDHQNPARPAHTRLLDQEIFIVENLCNLDSFVGESFQFFAVPIKAILILALAAAVLGARGVAGLSMDIANWLVIIFVVLAIVTFIL